MHGQQNIKITIINLFFPVRLVNGSFKMNLDKNVFFCIPPFPVQATCPAHGAFN